MEINFAELLKSMIVPLVIHPDEVEVVEENKEGLLNYLVLVSKDDLGRVIGKGGKICGAIRTICYAGATKEKVKLKIEFESKK